MKYSQPARITNRWILRILVASLLVVMAAIVVSFGEPLLMPLSPTATTPTDIPRNKHPQPQRAPRQLTGKTAAPTDIPRDEHRGALGEADGVVPDGVTVFDDIPAVANLDPELLQALREAATNAAVDKVQFFVNSGWRSPEYQNQLLREAISTYGSVEEAARWVATANTSSHVSGDAVDIGPFDATVWLSEHGVEYGLCQIYSNEAWHYELRHEAIDHGCPPMYADPTHDPRMQQ